MFAHPKLLGFEFLITAVINFLIDTPVKIKNNLNGKNSIIIGIAQALAIFPAISRSGSTIFAALRFGIDKKTAAEFSFLLSIPAIIGANILELYSHRVSVLTEFNFNYFAGFIAAFVVGLMSITVVFKFLKEKKFKIFGYYCLILGVLIIFFFPY